MPQAPNIVVIVADRLGSHWIGPYGNAWVETPALNRLAATSAVSEFMLSEACDLPTIYRTYWTGQSAWQNVQAGNPILPELARAAGYETRLVTDCEEVAHHPLASGFEQVDLLSWQRPARTAQESSQTRVAEVFAAARESMGSSTGSKFLWIHAAAMNAAWDAPYELRERLVAEDDPEPKKFVRPPELELAKDHDPDELLGIVQAYAAEVTSLDDCLGTFLESVSEDTLLVFTSSRGYPLGERLLVGQPGDSLHGEVLQVPLLVRSPGGVGKLTRVGELQQTSDVFAWIADHVAKRESGTRRRDLVVAWGPNEIALRTTHWSFRQRGTGDDRRCELYAKPDDFWEVNEVAARAAEVVTAFEELAEWIRGNRGSPKCPGLPPLPEILSEARR